MRIVLSSDPETTCLPSCENETDVTSLVCPVSTCRRAGQSTALPVKIDIVCGNLARYCFDITDRSGAKGSADK